MPAIGRVGEHLVIVRMAADRVPLAVALSFPWFLFPVAPSRPHRDDPLPFASWRLRGVRGNKLETILIGERRYTSQEALERFAARTTAIASGEQLPVRTSRQRQRSIEEAERELAKDGI